MGCRASTDQGQQSLAAGQAVQQALQRGDDRLFVEAVVHLAALLADADQAGATQQVEVMGNCRPAEGDALGNLPDVEFGTRQKLDEVLAHRVRQRGEQVAADSQVFAERADFGVEGAGIDQGSRRPARSPDGYVEARQHISARPRALPSQSRVCGTTALWKQFRKL
jgi:hypothetical protein